MITVRFPNGFSVQYNRGAKGSYKSDGTFEITDQNGGWVASLMPAGLVECSNPCRTYNPLTDTANEQIAALTKEIRALKRKLAKP